jgi:D-alanine--D-alanine ligase
MIKILREIMFNIAVICGGPSLERGISMNSARSLLDHLSSEQVNIVPIYVDLNKDFHLLSTSQLYSNTPADFDFKLSQTATPLNREALAQTLAGVDLVFPAIHGPFGEDGDLQALLQELNIPYVGSDSASCQRMFSKHVANQVLAQHNYPVIPSALLEANNPNNKKLIADFFKQQALTRAIIKPVAGGSSIGVFSVTNPEQALARADYLFEQKIDQYALLEPFCDGIEFTVLVFENQQGKPVALIPTEIEINYADGDIFDYRRKYLPTANTIYHTPARFTNDVMETIRQQAQDLFELFEMHDFARLDGWVLHDGGIYFTDFNPITGLEQNSFIFRQASVLGMSHRDALHYVIKNACRRQQLQFPQITTDTTHTQQPVHVLFGGQTAERQVSLMSGTNVWLKLLKSTCYRPIPYFLDQYGDVWQLPYSYTLNHTVEEIYDNCLICDSIAAKALPLITEVHEALGMVSDHALLSQKPMKMSLRQFAKQAQEQRAFVFIALHGGEGENGTLQQLFTEYHLPFNGSDAIGSALCMDKYMTGQAIKNLSLPDILSLPQKVITIDAFKGYTADQFQTYWDDLTQQTGHQRFIIKPRSDGCSTGIILLTQASDLQRYLQCLEQHLAYIPANTFVNQTGPIELPVVPPSALLIEPYIETDPIHIQHHQLDHQSTTGWIELTIGVLEQQEHYHALNPSITIAEGAVLSLEEKFQGGTGINLTPPPETLIDAKSVALIRQHIETIAKVLGINNYTRIDFFYNLNTQKIIIIEANSLPGLTPSTVIYHQALAETPPLSPQQFLEHLITTAWQDKIQ